MKLIVCPSCEKKLKVPDAIVAKGSFKCPACEQTLKLPRPKPRDDEEDLVELEADDVVEDELLEEDVDDDRFLESVREDKSSGQGSPARLTSPAL